MRRHRAWSAARTGLVAAGVAVLVGLLASCSSSGSAAIQGIQRPQPLDVSGVTLPEVAADGTTSPFPMTAPDGGLLIVYFGYTNCPDQCPTTLSDVHTALGDLGAKADAVEVAFATVDPNRDTPDKLVPFLRSFVADGHALRTDDPAALAAAEKPFEVQSSVTQNTDGSWDVQHTATTYVVDHQGRVVDEWTFGTTADAMASDLKTLLGQQQKTSA